MKLDDIWILPLEYCMKIGWDEKGQYLSPYCGDKPLGKIINKWIFKENAIKACWKHCGGSRGITIFETGLKAG